MRGDFCGKLVFVGNDVVKVHDKLIESSPE
jgi:hypothetical protein